MKFSPSFVSSLSASVILFSAWAFADTQACNNFPDLCSKSYSAITHLGAHDSPFLRDASTKFSISGNQYFDAPTALDAGVRLLQGQVHNENGESRLCHSSCELLDGGTLTDWLKKVATWMNSHPNDVVTIVLANVDNIPASTIRSSFDAASLSSIAYAPSLASITPSSWPTLAELIAAKTRLVVFLSAGADQNSVPFLLNEFNYVFETGFEVTAAKNFTCLPDRPSSLKGSISDAVSTRMGLMNHFLFVDSGFGILTPNSTYTPTLNGGDKSKVGNLASGLETCQTSWGGKPTFVLVDFFNEGPAIDVVDAFNGVSNPVGRKAPPSTPSKNNAANDTDPTNGGGPSALATVVLEVAAGKRNNTPGIWVVAAGTWMGLVGTSFNTGF